MAKSLLKKKEVATPPATATISFRVPAELIERKKKAEAAITAGGYEWELGDAFEAWLTARVAEVERELTSK